MIYFHYIKVPVCPCKLEYSLLGDGVKLDNGGHVGSLFMKFREDKTQEDLKDGAKFCCTYTSVINYIIGICK